MKKYPVIDLRKILDITDNVILITGLVLNLTLLYFVIKKTNKRLTDYKPILLQNCLIDIFYNSINAVTKPICDFKYGTFIASLSGAFTDIPDPWNNYLFAIWAFAILYCVTSIPVQFTYRYFLIVRNHKLSKCQYAMLLMASFFFAATYGCLNCFTFWPKPEQWPEKAKLLGEDAYYYAGIPSFVFADISQTPLKILFSYCYFLVLCSYTIVIIANYKVFKYLKNMRSSLSSSANEVQTQINYTFLIQACIPVVTSFLPIMTALTMTFLRGNIPGLGICVSLVWSWIPIANPLLTMIFIKQYRKTIVVWFQKIRNKSKIAGTSAAVFTTMNTNSPSPQLSVSTKAQE